VGPKDGLDAVMKRKIPSLLYSQIEVILFSSGLSEPWVRI